MLTRISDAVIKRRMVDLAILCQPKKPILVHQLRVSAIAQLEADKEKVQEIFEEIESYAEEAVTEDAYWEELKKKWGVK